MTERKVYTAIGLMSGTSLDGIDAALIETDGHHYVKPLDFVTRPYTDKTRESIRTVLGNKNPSDPNVVAVEDLLTQAHIDLLQEAGWPEKYKVDIIGFHGQTLYHAPEDGVTLQIGDGQKMADALGIDVVADFRSADVAAGGQGAPLVPLYHAARATLDGVEHPCAILNIGGVANVTYISSAPARHPREGGDPEQSAQEIDILAFDTGPGNALMDDWVKRCTGAPYDAGGALAAAGAPLDHIVKDWLTHPYFKEKPPKSLDRDAWRSITALPEGISTQDGAATLLAFTVQSILRARDHLPANPSAWYLCGGGRHNSALVAALSKHLPIKMVEDLGWNGDATEAECFAYLAVRSRLKRPLTLPTTTGVDKPISGGVLHKHD